MVIQGLKGTCLIDKKCKQSPQTKCKQSWSWQDIAPYKLSHVSPGVDSIIESIVSEQPDFDDAESLMQNIEEKIVEFAEKILFLLPKNA